MRCPDIVATGTRITAFGMAAAWITMSTMALAQTGGGYPASPSHGVVGGPAPDGSLRYGNEAGNTANPPAGSRGVRSEGAEKQPETERLKSEQLKSNETIGRSHGVGTQQR
jgi:hypothetical protein